MIRIACDYKQRLGAARNAVRIAFSQKATKFERNCLRLRQGNLKMKEKKRKNVARRPHFSYPLRPLCPQYDFPCKFNFSILTHWFGYRIRTRDHRHRAFLLRPAPSHYTNCALVWKSRRSVAFLTLTHRSCCVKKKMPHSSLQRSACDAFHSFNFTFQSSLCKLCSLTFVFTKKTF